MKNNIALIAFAAAMALSGSVHAATINANGTAQQIATVGAPVGSLNFTNLLGSDGKVVGSNQGVTFPSLANYKAKLKISSANGGLTTSDLTSAEKTDAQAAGFLTHVDYTASASFGGALPTFTTNGAPISNFLPMTGLATGSLSLNVAIPNGTAPVAAAAYSDTITVELGATF